MALPYTLTMDFTEAGDNLIQDATVTDSTLHSHAQAYLGVFNDTSTAAPVNPAPACVERIHKAYNPLWRLRFTTPSLFNAMYEVADELGLVAGRRYVSAAICVCGEHAARADAEGAQAARAPEDSDLVRALHELSSTWMVFLLWPFYAHRNADRSGEKEDANLPEASGDDTPTAESMARAHCRLLKQQVMARDNRRCFISGTLDSTGYYKGMPVPPGVTRVTPCCAVSIIPPEVLTPPDALSDNPDFQSDQEIMFAILKGFCGVDTATLTEQAQGPANTLLMNRSAESVFRKLEWCLHPTETADRYEIKQYDAMYDIGLGLPPVSSHITFVDHSASGVDLPSRELLRAHAALAGVLHRSGAMDVFWILHDEVPSWYREAGRSQSLYSDLTGGAFWRSVVEYGGPEVCLEVELWEAVEALRPE